jgi:hypothetical protein
VPAGKDPMGIAATVLYIACLNTGENIIILSINYSVLSKILAEKICTLYIYDDGLCNIFNLLCNFIMLVIGKPKDVS